MEGRTEILSEAGVDNLLYWNATEMIVVPLQSPSGLKSIALDFSLSSNVYWILSDIIIGTFKKGKTAPFHDGLLIPGRHC